MHGADPISPISRSSPVKNTVMVVVVGVIGLLTTMQWTANTVRKHARIASHSLFPAALKSQQATTAFQRMNSEYSDAVMMQEQKSLESAGREAASAVSALDSAGTSMEFNPGRHKQIVLLMGRVGDLQKRSKVLYSAAANVNGDLPMQEELANLSHEHRAIQTALETLQSDLASDFRAELVLIDKLLRIQGMLEAALLVGVITALFFSTRALIATAAQRRGEEVLRQAQRDTEILLNSVPSLLIGLDAQGSIRQWNQAATTILGWEEATVLGKTLDECGVKWLTPDTTARVAACVQTEATGSLDDVRLDRNGTTRFLGLNALRLNTDGAAGILVVGADITERKRAEKSENLLRMLMDQSHDIIEVIDPDTLRFVDFNERACQDSGYSREELLSMSISDIDPAFATAPRNVAKAQLQETGGSAILETMHRRKDGSTYPVEASVRHVQLDRGYWLCVVRDITDRQRLQQSQKLESIGQLAAGIAHEINTPTQYIGDNVRFLKDAFGELSSLLTNYGRLLEAAKGNTLSGETVHEVEAAVEHADVGYLLEEIPKAIAQTLEGVTRVAKLVGAMKDFSHPGTKDKILVDLNRAIESTITVARNEWKYVAEMETDYDSSLPPVLCLPAEFNQVILILIVNAAHAIADVVGEGNSGKGKITVQTRNGPECEIRIQDTGTGIPEKIRPRIFEPFFTTKEIGKGSGQGLAIARSVIVDKHGGTIHFETEEGKGTTFVVRLPHGDTALAAQGASA